MKRWIRQLGTKGASPRVDAFLADIEAVCRRHGLSLAHEDIGGGFRVTLLDEGNIEWVNNAGDELTIERPPEQVSEKEFRERGITI